MKKEYSIFVRVVLLYFNQSKTSDPKMDRLFSEDIIKLVRATVKWTP
jgi:hypothetical protein